MTDEYKQTAYDNYICTIVEMAMNNEHYKNLLIGLLTYCFDLLVSARKTLTAFSTEDLDCLTLLKILEETREAVGIGNDEKEDDK